MYRQPSRWERRLNYIDRAAQIGKFSIPLYLYHTEYMRLHKMGFSLSEPAKPFHDSQLITVSWNHLNTYLVSSHESLYRYCFLGTNIIPETDYPSDICFAKAIRYHLQNQADPEFIPALLDMLEINCCF